jgi:hypothetical protein
MPNHGISCGGLYVSERTRTRWDVTTMKQADGFASITLQTS